MLEIQDLTKNFGSKTAVDHIRFTVKPGEIFGFLGPNGAGKTTTLKMLMGILKADDGRVLFQGKDLIKDPMVAKRKFSYVPDNPDIYDDMTGIDYLRFIASVYAVPKKNAYDKISQLSDLFEIKMALPDPIRSYSHGMKQKICLIGALLHEPEIFIMDEPMVGLDPKSAFALKETMRSHCAQGHAVLFSTHVMEVAEKLCDRIGIIHHGKMIAEGTLQEIRDQAKDQGSLEEIFLEMTQL